MKCYREYWICQLYCRLTLWRCCKITFVTFRYIGDWKIGYKKIQRQMSEKTWKITQQRRQQTPKAWRKRLSSEKFALLLFIVSEEWVFGVNFSSLTIEDNFTVYPLFSNYVFSLVMNNISETAIRRVSAWHSKSIQYMGICTGLL